MSDRVSQIILLCEDDLQARLVRAYLRICGHESDVKPIVASRMQHGGNINWVIQRFPTELHACRQRHKVRAKTLLIVMVDADEFTVSERRQQLFDRLTADEYEKFGDNEPVALLIPKRHVETWISVLLGKTVTESENCKANRELKKEEIRQAAVELHSWARQTDKLAPNCVPSLASALPEWRRIC